VFVVPRLYIRAGVHAPQTMCRLSRRSSVTLPPSPCPLRSSVGVVTGFFLRHMDSVLKAVASAFEVVLSMLVSYVLFAVPLGPQARTAAHTHAARTLHGDSLAHASHPACHHPPPFLLWAAATCAAHARELRSAPVPCTGRGRRPPRWLRCCAVLATRCAFKIAGLCASGRRATPRARRRVGQQWQCRGE
jgi:hypothetical protein